MRSKPLNLGAPLEKIVERELSYAIQGSFYDVFNEMGPGLTEVLYSRALEIALKERGLSVERECPVQVHVRGHLIGSHRLDMLVNRRIIVENKARGEAA